MNTGYKGRYVYGIAPCGEVVELGPAGIEKNRVYTIPYEDICAIVHNCIPEPYKSASEEIVTGWVRAHQDILDRAARIFGCVIPMGFDVIVQPLNELDSPEQSVKGWLKGDYLRLKSIMERIEGRDEYAVQLFYEPAMVNRQILEQSQKIREIEKEIAAKPPGIAYLQRQRLEKIVRAEVEKLANDWFKDFYGRIKPLCDEIVIEKNRRAVSGRVMFLNCSCLVFRQKFESLGEELEKISGLAGFSVHFSGPWPPYSFVGKPAACTRVDA